MIDVHCHLLPGVDDGAVDLAATKQSIERMLEQGVKGVVVTPHVSTLQLLRPSGANRIARPLDEAWSEISELCAGEYPELTLRRGTELMLDHPSPDLSLEWVRLGGTRFVLVEFPGMMIPPRAVDAIAPLARAGYMPVIAHPERYRNGSENCAEAIAWKHAGARLQVNCGSLLGHYGSRVARCARQLLLRGEADYLASDYHARGPYPAKECRRVLEEIGGLEQSERLLCTNPARLLEGLEPLEVAPLKWVESRWKKLVGMRRLWSG